MTDDGCCTSRPPYSFPFFVLRIAYNTTKNGEGLGLGTRLELESRSGNETNPERGSRREHGRDGVEKDRGCEQYSFGLVRL